MAKKKPVNLAALTFSELRDKAKEIESFKSMNRFEITVAIKKAAGEALCPCQESANPRDVKPKINKLKTSLAACTDKKQRGVLRKAIARLKGQTRNIF